MKKYLIWLFFSTFIIIEFAESCGIGIENIIFIMYFVVPLIIYLVMVYNNIVSLNNNVKEAFSNIDVYLKKRWSLMNNLVDIVKGYTSHEEDTLTKVTELRNISYNSMSDEEKIKTNEKLSNGMYKIMAICENYPALKASENFRELTRQLAKIEEDIANSIINYNSTVKEFNNFIEVIPKIYIANCFGFTPKAMFGASEIEKSYVKVDFKK